MFECCCRPLFGGCFWLLEVGGCFLVVGGSFLEVECTPHKQTTNETPQTKAQNNETPQ